MTEQAPTASGNGSRIGLRPSNAEGWSKLALFAGLGILAVGHLLEASGVVWTSVAVIVLAFGLNTAAKLLHYRELALPRSETTKLALSWVLLALTVVALVLNYAYTRFGPGDGSFFWALGAAGLGFGLLHMAAQSTYLDGVNPPD